MLGVTMRVTRIEYPGGTFETRDAISQDWPRFLTVALPCETYVLLPNTGSSVIRHVEKLGVNSLLLTGGEDLGVWPERDQTETSLFGWAIKHDYPVMGICRGAQVVNHMLGGELTRCAGHAAGRHEIELVDKFFLADFPLKVNSFHTNCIMPRGLASDLRPFALSQDGQVEGFFGANGKICGLMWHPEREASPTAHDTWLFRNFFGAGSNA